MMCNNLLYQTLLNGSCELYYPWCVWCPFSNDTWNLEWCSPWRSMDTKVWRPASGILFWIELVLFFWIFWYIICIFKILKWISFIFLNFLIYNCIFKILKWISFIFLIFWYIICIFKNLKWISFIFWFFWYIIVFLRF